MSRFLRLSRDVPNFRQEKWQSLAPLITDREAMTMNSTTQNTYLMNVWNLAHPFLAHTNGVRLSFFLVFWKPCYETSLSALLTHAEDWTSLEFKLEGLDNWGDYFPVLFYPPSHCDSSAICCGCKCLLVGIIFSLSDDAKPNPSCRRHTNTHARTHIVTLFLLWNVLHNLISSLWIF